MLIISWLSKNASDSNRPLFQFTFYPLSYYWHDYVILIILMKKSNDNSTTLPKIWLSYFLLIGDVILFEFHELVVFQNITVFTKCFCQLWRWYSSKSPTWAGASEPLNKGVDVKFGWTFYYYCSSLESRLKSFMTQIKTKDLKVQYPRLWSHCLVCSVGNWEWACGNCNLNLC